MSFNKSIVFEGPQKLNQKGLRDQKKKKKKKKDCKRHLLLFFPHSIADCY